LEYAAVNLERRPKTHILISIVFHDNSAVDFGFMTGAREV
jgi:hypothetical protein